MLTDLLYLSTECPDCGDDPEQEATHRTTCWRVGTTKSLQCGPPWNELPPWIARPRAEAECTGAPSAIWPGTVAHFTFCRVHPDARPWRT